ncbi:hypothetical protein ACHAWU_002313 [Discostella pseudostelligera]|uniref:Oxidation resistance protein 1 n=1 Tax=Discostella pseudostelligera TaxID=259834 RepID=A0ABD3MMZ5_9STRA
MNDNRHQHHQHHHPYFRRQASLSEVERTFLSHLLIDLPPNTNIDEGEFDNDGDMNASSTLNDEILFSLPIAGLLFTSSSSSSALEDIIASSERDSRQRRRSSNPAQQHPTIVAKEEGKEVVAHSELWKAYHHGIIRRRHRGVGGRGGDDVGRRGSTGGGGKRGIRTRRFWQRRERSSGAQLEKDDIDYNDDDGNNEYYGTDNIGDQRVAEGVGGLGVVTVGGGGDEEYSNSDALDNDSSLLDNNNHLKNDTVENVSGNDYNYRDVDDADDDFNNIQSDNEVGTIHDESSASSWNSSQGGFDHYDAWEVLHDEYAPEFGYQVAEEEEDSVAHDDDDEDDDRPRPFKILGTSAYDVSALPHVLSPPLMDSLLNFVPDHLSSCNYWLKYSLVRDGASLDILRRYCRAATHTVLAIETTNGDVFGSFSSSPWTCRRHRPNGNTFGSGFYGTGESFLWRMRSNRNTPVHSLFEQAQLESEIDVYPYNGSNDYVQLCTRDMLALGGGGVGGNSGGGEQPPPLDDDDAPPVVLEDIVNYGFGLALDKYLLHGTTSPSATFGNSNLTSHRINIDNVDGGVTFDVKNLEVWGFTSANTVSDAQKSEMSVYFARESISSSMTSTSSIGASFGGRSDHQLFEADDLSQDRFYRRIGRNDENEVDRSAWQYANMMNPVAGSSPYGNMGSSSPYGR